MKWLMEWPGWFWWLWTAFWIYMLWTVRSDLSQIGLVTLAVSVLAFPVSWMLICGAGKLFHIFLKG